MDDPQQSPNKPEWLYHYTSASAIEKILCSKNMRASDVRFMNDIAEQTHGVAPAFWLIEFSPQTLEDEAIDGALVFEFQRVLNPIRIRPSENSIASRAFSISFSEESDMLSQWRAYCPPEGGFCVGVRRSMIEARAKEQGFELGKCEYIESDRNEMLVTLIKRILREKTQRLDEEARHDTRDHAIATLAREALNEFIDGSVFLKHRAFREEKEWRVVLRRQSESEQSSVEYFERRGNFVPFVNFELKRPMGSPIQETSGPDLHVCIGPRGRGAQSAIAEAAARHLTKLWGADVQLTISSAPFDPRA